MGCVMLSKRAALRAVYFHDPYGARIYKGATFYRPAPNHRVSLEECNGLCPVCYEMTL